MEFPPNLQSRVSFAHRTFLYIDVHLCTRQFADVLGSVANIITQGVFMAYGRKYYKKGYGRKSYGRKSSYGRKKVYKVVYFR